jgi:ribosomal-protein-alanine N-acetyltransferase
MLNINFNPFPLITTTRLQLKQVNKSDVNEILFLRSDNRVMKYLDRVPAKTIYDAYEFIKKINLQEKNNESITWAITIKDIDKLIGTICLWNILKEHYRAEIGYVLHPDYWGKGIMQEAFSEVINFGFRIMKLHSIEAIVNPANEASIKLLEKNNFTREAYFKENYYYDGKFLDSAVYSLLTTEHERE